MARDPPSDPTRIHSFMPLHMPLSILRLLHFTMLSFPALLASIAARDTTRLPIEPRLGMWQ